MQTPKFSKKDLLLCFDAFGTLFAPKTPVAAQYGEIARQHGLSGFSNDQVQNAFKKGAAALLYIKNENFADVIYRFQRRVQGEAKLW